MTTEVIYPTKDFPIGAIIMWDKSALSDTTLQAGWIECNGQAYPADKSPLITQVNTPDYRTKFPRGDTTSRGTGGSATSTTGTPSATVLIPPGIAVGAASDRHTHVVTTVPPYLNMVFIQRYK